MTAKRLANILVLAIIFLVINLAPGQCQWQKGIIHVHTTFSDGSDNIPQRVKTAKADGNDDTPQFALAAKHDGCKFIIITDHDEQIALEKDNFIRKRIGSDFGFGDYLRNCLEQTTSDFVCIPGAEIATFWQPEANTDAASHTLILGADGYDEALNNLQLKQGNQQAVINRINALGKLSVAAHPTLVSNMSLRWKFWQGSDFRYDLRPANEQPNGQIQYQNVSGIEMFNVENNNQQTELINRYLSLIAQKIPVFVTSGCDSHKWAPTNVQKDYEMWGRQTWVYADELSENSILQALREGHSYAANYRAQFKNLQPIPGFKAQKVEQAKFSFTVVYAKITINKKVVRIYRDGVLVPESVREYAGGKKELSYQWTDQNVQKGQHWYIIEVLNALITSPAVLNVGVEELPIISTTKTVALAMDASGSMAGYKMQRAGQAASALIDLWQTGDYVTILEFSAVSKLSLPLTEISQALKSDFKSKLYAHPDQQSTNIGSGLDLAISELERINIDSSKKSIVLMSDGRHNTGTLWPSVEECKKRNYKVYTVAFGADADLATLQKIAEETGGECSYGDIRNLVQIYNLVSGQINKRSTFDTASMWLRPKESITYKINISDYQATSLFIDWQGSHVKATLTAPNGQEINPDNCSQNNARYMERDNYSFYELQKPQDGQWKINLFGEDIPTQGEQINVSASGQDDKIYATLMSMKTSYSRGENIPIIIKACQISASQTLTPADKVEVRGSVCQPEIRPNEFIRRGKINLGTLLVRAIDQSKSLKFQDLGNGKFLANFPSKMNGIHTINITIKVTVGGIISERKLHSTVIVGKIEDFTLRDFLEMLPRK